MYFLAAGWKPFNILYITKCLTYNISRKQISIARYYIYRMKAAVLIIFILVAQVFADFHSIGFDGVDPDAYEASIDSMPIIADSVTKLFSLPDSSLIQAASDFYSFKIVFNPIRDSLILFYTEHPEEPLDSLRQEVLLNWSCRHLLHCYSRKSIGSVFYISRGQFQVFEDNEEGIDQTLSFLPDTSYYWIYLEQKPHIDSMVAQQKPNVRHKVQGALTQITYRMQRDTLSRKERREYLQLMDRQLDSVANVCHLGIYGRSQLGYYTPRRFFAFDLSFFMAMLTIDDSFNKIRFYGGDISVKATTSKGDFGLGFSVGFGKNEGDDIRYEDIYHKGGETAGGVAPYITYGYPVFDNTDHRIIPTVKLCYYSGSSGDESIPAKDDTHKQFFYSLGIRYEYTVNAPVEKEDFRKGLLHDAVFATINFGFDVNMYAADVIAIRAFVGLGLGLFK